MANLKLTDINKIYHTGKTQSHIIKDANLEINEGEFVVFVGPSGCGKSTMLRMIAGLEDISSGTLAFDGTVVNQMAPSERGIGMVFQSYALYPHMTVRENIAFGVKYTRDWSKEQVTDAVNQVAESLELTHLLDKKPGQMSGGQRQRVAIGRALIRQPKVFLLDEPLSNLDAALRVRMRMQIAAFHKKFNSTTIYVTHDQVEAMTLADKVVVLNGGNIEQVGSPLELYHFPRTEFVANFIGSPKMNMLPVTFVSQHDELLEVDYQGQAIKVAAKAEGLNKGDKLTLGVRPEGIEVVNNDGDIHLRVITKELLGSESIIYCQLPDSDEEFLVRCSGTVDVEDQKQISVQLAARECHLFLPDGIALPRTVTHDELVTTPQMA